MTGRSRKPAEPAGVVDEPQVASPPAVADRDGRVWTRVADGQWRHIREADDSGEQGVEFNVGWQMLRDLLGPLSAVASPLDGS